MLQLLESDDRALLETITSSNDVMSVVREISERHIESEDEGEDSEDGEGEVVALARRCLEMASAFSGDDTSTVVSTTPRGPSSKESTVSMDSPTASATSQI